MNILFISSEYPPETGFGGIGTYTRTMAHSLYNRGHNIDVIALSEKDHPYEYSDTGVSVYRIRPGEFPLPKGPLFYHYRRICTKFLFNSLVRQAFSRAAAKKYALLASQKKYDIIESAECGAEGFYIKPVLDGKTVIRLHSPFSYIARLDHLGLGFFDLRKLEFMERETTLRAHGVSSPSRALKRVLQEKWKLREVVSFPNPMDTSDYLPKQGKGDYIIYTGRVEYNKGVHVLIKAYSQIIKEGLDIPLLLVGAPYGVIKKILPYEKLIEDLIEKLDLKDKVKWIKTAGREDIRKYLAHATVAVYPSLWENFPYACLEAMASGVPVIASRSGGLEEIVAHKETGFLSDVLNHNMLSETLKNVLGDYDMSCRIGLAGRSWVISNCNQDKIAETSGTFL